MSVEYQKLVLRCNQGTAVLHLTGCCSFHYKLICLINKVITQKVTYRQWQIKRQIRHTISQYDWNDTVSCLWRHDHSRSKDNATEHDDDVTAMSPWAQRAVATYLQTESLYKKESFINALILVNELPGAFLLIQEVTLYPVTHDQKVM